MLVMSGNVFAVPSSLPVPGFSPDLINESSNPNPKPISNTNPSAKKKRNLPGTPDPDAEVIALSPKTLMATNRFICEICNKGFQREQNLQLHRRGHNLPWKLRQKTNKDQVKKKVYICPEKTCVHHDPCRALGDLTGIKKHFSRKHGEKKWKCEKCSKKYAVQSDWKAHSKTCGTREYKCDCGTLFSRKDSFITHRAFCDALAEESSRITSIPTSNLNFRNDLPAHVFTGGSTGIPQIGGAEFGNQLKPPPPRLSLWLDQANSQQLNSVDVSGNSSIYMNSANIFTSSAGGNLSLSPLPPLQQSLKEVDGGIMNKSTSMAETLSSLFSDDNHRNIGSNSSGPMSATALLQKAAQMGSTKSNPIFFGNSLGVMSSSNSSSSSPVPVPVPAFSLSHNRNQQLLQTTTSSLDNNSFEFDQSMLQTSQNESPSTTTVTMMNFQGQGLNGGSVEHHNSLTRDFLGMGAGEGGRPLLPHELAKFASMSSAMGLDLGHFSSHH